ncbi:MULTISPECIES: DUF4375 domain-containing protein [unclassified Pseudomonas]|uniref:DMP19 family protein n=1 Tax=unclassified Pseudomonas TaxID=196821 RepID=UPI00096993FC|nr:MULTISPECIES: DUF4375 domain-containing protein [unclassified Pseudomonas]OLU13030.1 hypothetical protein BVH01_21965 [Pseudomonas sp. PA1(2017)]OLU34475.1 hypothetical protein BVH06_05625 [Pseudomonas sp. PA27(2017)]
MSHPLHAELGCLQIERVAVDSQAAHIHLRNGQQFSLPSDGYLRLDRLSAEQRQDVRLEDGFIASWRHQGAGACDSLDLVWDELQDQSMRRLDQAGWDLQALDRRDQQLVALWRLQADYYNGGLMQFFANWGMPTFELAQQALTLIGLPAACQALRDLYAVFARLQDEPEDIALWDICSWLSEAENARIDELEEGFEALISSLPVQALHHFLVVDAERPLTD